MPIEDFLPFVSHVMLIGDKRDLSAASSHSRMVRCYCELCEMKWCCSYSCILCEMDTKAGEPRDKLLLEAKTLMADLALNARKSKHR